jgi:hypothetical protein
MKMHLLAKGRTAEIFAWHDGRIVKLFHPWCPGEWIEREARIAVTVRAAGLPTPECYGQVEVEGRKGIVYERLSGPSLLAALSSSPWRIGTYARQLAGIHLQINREPGNGLPDLAAYLRKAIVGADALSDRQKEAACRTLDRLPSGDRLCHFDFHPDQVILTRDGPKVIDWLTAFKGDPAADVARTSLLMELGSVEHLALPVRVLVALAKRQFARSYLRCYAAGCEAGFVERVQQWKLPVAAARLKEEVPGERERLLPMIEGVVAAGSV